MGWTSHDGLTDGGRRYFALLEQIQQHRKARNYPAMAACCKASIPFLQSLAERGVPPSIPALEYGVGYWGEVEDLETLRWVRQIVLTVPEISRDWVALIDETMAFASETRALRSTLAPFLASNPRFPKTGEAIRLAAAHQPQLQKLLPFLRANPGFPQSKVRSAVGVSVKEISGLLECLEREGYLRREKVEGARRLSLSE
jgi:hypothetical protein